MIECKDFCEQDEVLFDAWVLVLGGFNFGSGNVEEQVENMCIDHCKPFLLEDFVVFDLIRFC